MSRISKENDEDNWCHHLSPRKALGQSGLRLVPVLPHFPERRFPPEPFFEYDRSPHPFRDKVTREKFIRKEGYLDIPHRQGLGITLNDDFVKKNTIL